MLPLTIRIPLLLSATLVVASCGGGSGDTASASAEATGSETGAPLEPGVVELRLDAQGIAHLRAPTDSSLFWAAGYVQAETRLVQMLLLRRRALGRQAELLGADKLAEDQLSRIFNFRDLGARDMARLLEEQPEDHALIEAWVAGVNAYITAVNAGDVPAPTGLGAESLDHTPQPWTADDVGAIAKLLMFANSNSLENELLATILARLDPNLLVDLSLPLPAYPVFTLPPEDVPAGAPSPGGPGNPASLMPVLPPAPAIDPRPTIAGLQRLHETLDAFSVDGSNAWVVAGEHTATGRPLLANDPHQPLSSPALVYGLHLDSATAGSGAFNVAGFCFAGTPGVQLGHNEAVAWGATTGSADVMDLWSVSTDAAAGTAQVGGEAVAYASREEPISVRGGEQQQLIVDELEGYGVLLGDALLEGLGINEAFVAGAGRRLLLNWTGFAAGNELHAFFEMARADSADAYQAAAEQMEVGTFNWMFADAQSIGYRSRVLVPDRGDPSTIGLPSVMLDGDDASTLWSGEFLTDALLPGSRDPSQGFLLSANNEPYGFSVDGDLSNDPFYFGTFFQPGFRAKRGQDELQRLLEGGAVSLADMQTLQMDTYASEADLILPALSAAWEAVGSDPLLAAYEGRAELGALVEALEAWDRRMAAGSGAAVAFYVFAHELARVSVGDELSLVFDAIVGAAPAFALKFSALTVTGAYPGSEALIDSSVNELALAALDATASWMSANAGGTSTAGLRWDAFHITSFASPVEALSWGEIGSAGSVGTLNQNTAAYLDAGGEVGARFVSEDGPMFRGTVSFEDDGRPRLHYNFAPGNGGDPAGEYWGDRVEDWLAGVYTPMPYTAAEIEAATVAERIIAVPQAYR